MKNTISKIALLPVIATLIACAPGGSSDLQIDLIIEGQTIVTMDAANTVIENGAVAIDDGFILAVGTAEEITTEYSAAETLAGKNRIVMPGLVNGHSHAAMTLLRGMADDLALMDWLNNYIFPGPYG